MLKRLRKLKSDVRYFANYKNNQDSNITAKELQLVTKIILLLKPFFAAKECTGLPQGQKSQEIRKIQEKLRKMTEVR